MGIGVRSDGYGVFDLVLAPDDVARVIDALDAAGLSRSRAGARHVLRLPAVAALARDSRLLAIARAFIGAGVTPFRATLFDKSSRSNWLVPWHQDTALPLAARVDRAEWGPWSTKGGILYAHAPAWALEQVVALRVSLDASTATNGPLRLLPDSHRCGVLTDREIEQLAQAVPGIDCVTAAGGVVAMRPLTVHASSKARTPARRRVLHIEYAAALVLGNGLELALA